MGIGLALAGGSYLGAKAQQDAAQTQADAAMQAAETSAQTQQDMFQQGLGIAQPYLDTGQQALQGLGQFMTPEGQAGMLNQYTQSPLYQQQIQAGSENVLRNQAATGALRTGQADFALGSLPIQMQQNYMQNQFGRLQGMAGLGANAAGQAFGGYQNLGATVGQTMGQGIQQQGAFQAQANQAMPMATAGLMNDVAGLGLYALSAAGGVPGGFGGMGGGAPQQPDNSGFSYNYGSRI